MKKILIILILAAIMTGTAFADHPKGFGIGIVGFYPGGGGLSLKIPSIPIFWAVNLGFGGHDYWGYKDSWFSINLTGDYYFLDNRLGGPVHWFLGVGGFLGVENHSGKSGDTDWGWTDVHLGARIPIGLSIQPVKIFEIFLDIAPGFGINFYGDSKHGNYGRGSGMGSFWYWPIELGLRFWF